MKTIGIVVVAAFAASAAGVPVATSRSPGDGPDRPPAPATDRIGPSAQRYSIATFLALDIAGFAQPLAKREPPIGRESPQALRC